MSEVWDLDAERDDYVDDSGPRFKLAGIEFRCLSRAPADAEWALRAAATDQLTVKVAAARQFIRQIVVPELRPELDEVLSRTEQTIDDGVVRYRNVSQETLMNLYTRIVNHYVGRRPFPASSGSSPGQQNGKATSEDAADSPASTEGTSTSLGGST